MQLTKLLKESAYSQSLVPRRYDNDSLLMCWLFYLNYVPMFGMIVAIYYCLNNPSNNVLSNARFFLSLCNMYGGIVLTVSDLL